MAMLLPVHEHNVNNYMLEENSEKKRHNSAGKSFVTLVNRLVANVTFCKHTCCEQSECSQVSCLQNR